MTRDDMPPRQPWDRLDGEGQKAFECFRVYLDMPPAKRFLAQVSLQVYGPMKRPGDSRQPVHLRGRALRARPHQSAWKDRRPARCSARSGNEPVFRCNEPQPRGR